MYFNGGQTGLMDLQYFVGDNRTDKYYALTNGQDEEIDYEYSKHNFEEN